MATTAHGSDLDGAGGRTGLALASARERLAAFRRARRHTWIVRALKTALPVAAGLSLIVYGSLVFTVVGYRPKNFDPGTMHVTTENLVMENPKYDGFGSDGTRYQMRAKNAVTDLKMSGPVRLNAIDGDLVQPTGAVTKLKATWGTFDQKENRIELYERIDIDGSTGMAARLTRATVYTKENRITSNEPVLVELPTATVRSRGMALNTKSRQILFEGDVNVHLKPAAGKNGTSQPSDAPSASPLPALALNSDAPIDVRSDRLDVDDMAKTAVFRSNVTARQGDAVLVTPLLEAIYEGSGADGVAGRAQTASEQASRLKLLKARDGVRMVLKDDRATGDTLDYDVAGGRALLQGNVVLTSTNDRRATSDAAVFDRVADTALLTGNVIVTQGKNTMRGERLLFEHKLGKTRLESPAKDGHQSGRIAALFYRDEANASGAGAKGKNSQPDMTDAESRGMPLGAAFKTDPRAPIEVEADTLDVLDQEKVAVFKGTVHAKQGDFTVRCAEMTAHYTGQSGLGATSQSASGVRQPSQLTNIVARRNVVITSGDGRTATGDRADFDVKSNMAVVSGKVIVSQGKSVVEGTKLIIDMNTGRSRFEIAEGQQTDTAAAGATATCPAGQVCKRRIRAVFYPKELEAAKKADGRGSEPSNGAAGGRQPGTSSWSSTTRRSGAE